MPKNHLQRRRVSHSLAVLAIYLSLLGAAQAGLWLTNSPMLNARVRATATLLQNGKILLAGGETNGVSTNRAELYDPATGTWTPTASMHTARWSHTATLLHNGKVLVAGGYNTDYLTSAELYDPNTGSWTVTGPLNIARGGFTATLLPDGRVLAASGQSRNTNTPTAEIYDPATGSWTQTENMHDGRFRHTATLLPNGQVLVCGGDGNGSSPARVLSTMELFDPLQEKWTSAGSMFAPRLGHTATLLPNGKVLLSGGITNWVPTSPVSSAEVYDPLTGTNTLISSMNAPRAYHTATLLPNGTVMVTGGVTYPAGDPLNSAEIYDPTSDTWTLTNALVTARYFHTATLLPNGEVVVAGGAIDYADSGLSSTELYDPTIAPATGAWTFTSSMQSPRDSFTMTLLPNGKVLVAGGNGAPGYAACELYDPTTGTWANTGSLNYGRFNHTATLLPNGKVLVVGGAGGTIPVWFPELYDPATGSWTTNTFLNSPVYANTATLLRNGKVLVAGESNPTNSAQLYDPSSGRWTATGQMITPRTWHKAVLLPNGKVLVVGGESGGTHGLSNAEMYDPLAGQWTGVGSTRAYSAVYTAPALLPNGKVLVPGADTNGSAVADLFDPQTCLWTATGSPRTNHFAPTLIVLPTGKALLVGLGGTPELYDPATGQWTTTPAMQLDRQHDCAILLRDGRVLVAGGYATIGNSEVDTATAEVYDSGLFTTNSSPPQIASATSSFNLGETLTVTGSGFRGISAGSSGNAQDSSTAYPLVQLRNLENGQSTFLLTTNWSATSFTSRPVWNFPPGQALVTVFANAIQSTSTAVNITVPVPAMTILANSQVLPNGSFQFAFTNHPGAVLGVLASTNVTLPLNAWTPLSGVSEISPGQFQFTDPQATNGSQHFYQLFAP